MQRHRLDETRRIPLESRESPAESWKTWRHWDGKWDDARPLLAKLDARRHEWGFISVYSNIE